MTDAPAGKRAFFVSYNGADRAWASWIAWVLEEAGYSVFFQDWDFRGNFVEHMNRAHTQADRTLAVLSDHYFGSDFTLAEWSARFAQDPAARQDRLVPVKVGPLAGEGILGPIVHADLTGCEEAEAHRRLLGRVKKAVDAGHRDKPPSRPGFPGGPPREVPGRPVFPAHGIMPAAGREEEGPAMTGARSINVGRDAVGNVMVTGDRNRVDARIEAKLVRTSLPSAGAVDIGHELIAIRAVLERLGGEQAKKIGRALDDAEEEARKPEPNRQEIGEALERAFKTARSATGFAEEMARLAPHVKNAVGWLGANWHKLLAVVGLAV